ncbi:hypothetical protein CW751_05055 [Brumimicrobium salinarum]|uniref:Uncharacterized protein n=1 Tax=Brumimicrobium salinarum TaxID=2058658 RepID=A0A2I0R4C4_9FLAO|nr:hypothetical protein CW751_05055 [Brumimicrobium salinarum]
MAMVTTNKTRYISFKKAGRMYSKGWSTIADIICAEVLSIVNKNTPKTSVRTRPSRYSFFNRKLKITMFYVFSF